MQIFIVFWVTLLIAGCAAQQPVSSTSRTTASGIQNIATLRYNTYALLEKKEAGFRFTQYAVHSKLLKGSWVSIATGLPTWDTQKKEACYKRVIGTAKQSDKPDCATLPPAKPEQFLSIVMAENKAQVPRRIDDDYHRTFDQHKYTAAFNEAMQAAIEAGHIDLALVPFINDLSKQLYDIARASHDETINNAYRAVGLTLNGDYPSYGRAGLPIIRADSFPSLAQQLTSQKFRYLRIAKRLQAMARDTEKKQQLIEAQREDLAAAEKERQALEAAAQKEREAKVQRLAHYKRLFKNANTPQKMQAFIHRYQQEGYDPLNYLPQAETQYHVLLEEAAKQRRHQQLKDMGGLLKSTLEGMSQ